MAKLEILTPEEQIIFNSPPNFSQDEQNKYFCLPPELAIRLKSVDNITNKVGFIWHRQLNFCGRLGII